MRIGATTGTCTGSWAYSRNPPLSGFCCCSTNVALMSFRSGISMTLMCIYFQHSKKRCFHQNMIALYARVGIDNKGQDPETQLHVLRPWADNGCIWWRPLNSTNTVVTAKPTPRAKTDQPYKAMDGSGKAIKGTTSVVTGGG